MKGFLGALCVFLLWSAACVYYVSTNELVNKIDTPSQDTPLQVKQRDPLLENPNPVVKNAVITDDFPLKDTTNLEDSSGITTESMEESKLLIDELKKSIAVSDTVDFNRDEPELKPEKSLEIAPEISVTSNTFYPYYNNSDLIMDEDLVAYADELKKILRKEPSKRVLIVGHTDNVGNSTDNFNIGLKKARQVKWYLTVRRGIPRGKVKAISQGESVPVESNTSSWGRKRNNRLEIIVE